MKEKEPKKKKYNPAIPLVDRTPESIAEALAERDEYSREQILRLHAYAVEHRLGLSKLALESGISHSVLSEAFSGSYGASLTGIAAQIEKFFFRAEQKQLYGGIRAFCETRLAQSLWTVYDKTRITRRIQPIQSDEQLGKSRASREYTHRNNSGRTHMVTIPGNVRKGMNDFILALAHTLDLPYTIKISEKRLRIKARLATCDLLIIDEWHLTNKWTNQAREDLFDYIRTDLHADGERGVVLIATNTDVMSDIHKFRDESGYNIGQLLGRMSHDVIELDGTDDVLLEDVEMFAQRFWEKGSPGAEVVKKLHAAASRPGLGHYGLIDYVLNEAWARAKSVNQPVTDRVVTETLAQVLSKLNEEHEKSTARKRGMRR